jgi:hypothetical protein
MKRRESHWDRFRCRIQSGFLWQCVHQYARCRADPSLRFRRSKLRDISVSCRVLGMCKNAHHVLFPREVRKSVNVMPAAAATTCSCSPVCGCNGPFTSLNVLTSGQGVCPHLLHPQLVGVRELRLDQMTAPDQESSVRRSIHVHCCQ